MSLFLEQFEQKFFHHIYANEHRIIFNDVSIYTNYNDIADKESASGSSLRLGTWLLNKSNEEEPMYVSIAMKFLKYNTIFQKHLKETLEHVITNEWKLFISQGNSFHLLMYIYLKLGYNKISPECTCKECIHYNGAIQIYEQKIHGRNNNNNNSASLVENNPNNYKILSHKLQTDEHYQKFLNELLTKKIPRCNDESIEIIVFNTLTNYFPNFQLFEQKSKEKDLIYMMLFINKYLLTQIDFINYFENLDEKLHTTARHFTDIEKHCMETEVLIYLQVIHRLLTNYCTPCLLFMYSHECLEFSQYIVLEQQKYSFYKYIQKFPEKFDEVVNPQFLFMLIYTLACFEEIGFQHNDLHFSNFFIEEYESPIPKLYFMINKNEAVVLENIRYIPKIYDFDRSTVFKTKHSHEILSKTFISQALPLLYCKLTVDNPESNLKSQSFHLINNVRNKNWDLSVLLIGLIRATEIHITKTKKDSKFFRKMNLQNFKNYMLNNVNETISVVTKLLNLLEIFPMPVIYDRKKKEHVYYLAHTLKNIKNKTKINTKFYVHNRCSPYFKKRNTNGFDVTPYYEGQYVPLFCSFTENEHNTNYEKFGHCSSCNLNQNTNPKHPILNPYITPLNLITNKLILQKLFLCKMIPISNLDCKYEIIFKLPHLVSKI